MRRFALLVLLGPAALLAAPGALLSGRDLFHPVIAEHAMVASQEAQATRAGLEILKAGGNAMDAAVTVAFCLAVTLPRAGNLGGGGFLLYYDAKTGRVSALDFRERAPLAAHRDMFLGPAGLVDDRKKQFSLHAVGVPGTVAGLALGLERFGSIPLARAIEPAERLAREGFPVYPDLANSLETNKTILRAYPATLATYFGPGERTPLPGEKLAQPDLARSLGLIQKEGPAAFYEGELADKIVAYMRSAGGLITARDLREYRPVWRETVRGTYRGFAVHSMPPPSSGGTHLIQMLKILEGFPLRSHGHNSAAGIHILVETMKRAYADRSLHLGDPDFERIPTAALTSSAYAARLRARIPVLRATPARQIRPTPAASLPAVREGEHTTHFSVVDSQGSAVALTYTLNFDYGVGAVVPGTGILLNNEMDDFSAKPGTRDGYGLVGGLKNAVAPGKRMLSSMSPTIVLRDGKLFLVTGSPGGARIITTVLQIILNTVDHGMNIAAATAAVRVHHQWQPDFIRVERGLSVDTLRLLRSRGHTLREEDAMGSTQSIMVAEGLKKGASDPRTEGGLTAGY